MNARIKALSSTGKRQAALWAERHRLEWREEGGSLIAVHFPGDDYLDRNGNKQPSFVAIYDETYGDCYEFRPPYFNFSSTPKVSTPKKESPSYEKAR